MDLDAGLRMRWGVQMPKLQKSNNKNQGTHTHTHTCRERKTFTSYCFPNSFVCLWSHNLKTTLHKTKCPTKTRIPHTHTHTLTHTHAWPKVSQNLYIKRGKWFTPAVGCKQELALIINFNLITKTEFNPSELCRWLAHLCKNMPRFQGLCVGVSGVSVWLWTTKDAY